MANSAHEEAARRYSNGDHSQPDMTGYDLSRGLFFFARFEGVCLADAKLKKANFCGAYFRGSNLSGADLSNADVGTTDLRDVDLSNANLSGARLENAVLNGATLRDANLSGASLVKARLSGVDMTGANLDGADLRGIYGLTAEHLESALNADSAILDQRTLSLLARSGDVQTARHGHNQPAEEEEGSGVTLRFTDKRPMFGDLYQICGDDHPNFSPSGEFAFEELADLGVEQMDDYFAICVDGDPVIWISPVVKGRIVEHYPGPFDALDVSLDLEMGEEHLALFENCIQRMCAVLPVKLK